MLQSGMGEQYSVRGRSKTSTEMTEWQDHRDRASFDDIPDILREAQEKDIEVVQVWIAPEKR